MMLSEEHYEKEFERLQRRIIALQQRNELEGEKFRWVKVTEKLPEDGDQVIVYGEGQFNQIRRYCIGSFKPERGWDCPIYNVIKWRPFEGCTLEGDDE